MESKNLFDQIKKASLTPEEIKLMVMSVKASMYRSVTGIMDNIDQLKDSSNKLAATILKMEEESSKKKLSDIDLDSGGGLQEALELVKNTMNTKHPMDSDLKLYQELLNEITLFIDNSYYYEDGTRLMDIVDKDDKSEKTYVDPEKLDFNKLHARLIELTSKYNSFVDYNSMFFTKGVDIMTGMVLKAISERDMPEEQSQELINEVNEQTSNMLEPFIKAVDASKKGFKSAVESMENYKSLNSKMNLLNEIIN
jgi:hypothetical protein